MSIKDGLASKLLRRGPLFQKISRELAASEFLSAQQLTALQNQKLQKIIQYSYRHVPYYRKLFDLHGIHPQDIRTASDLAKIPILTRKDLLDNFDDLRSRRTPKLILSEDHTSGTTGYSCRFCRDLYSINYENATIWRQWRSIGIKESDRIAVCRSVVVLPREREHPPFWTEDTAQHQLMLSAYHLKEEWLPAYINAIRDYGAVALQAYPSIAVIIARYLLKTRQKMPLKAVLTSSEPVYAHDRELIELAFGCKIWDFYGLGERVASAYECEAHDGLHINEEYGILELIDAKGDVAQDEGVVVGTSLNNYAMPLIRYKVDDMGKYMTEPCSCGRHSRRLQPIESRVADLLFAFDGRPVPPMPLGRVLKKVKHVDKSQFIQYSREHIEIKIIPSSELFFLEDKAKLENEMHLLFGADVNIEVTTTKDIPTTASGKYRWIISKAGEVNG